MCYLCAESVRLTLGLRDLTAQVIRRWVGIALGHRHLAMSKHLAQGQQIPAPHDPGAAKWCRRSCQWKSSSFARSTAFSKAVLMPRALVLNTRPSRGPGRRRRGPSPSQPVRCRAILAPMAVRLTAYDAKMALLRCFAGHRDHQHRVNVLGRENYPGALERQLGYVLVPSCAEHLTEQSLHSEPWVPDTSIPHHSVAALGVVPGVTAVASATRRARRLANTRYWAVFKALRS